MVSFRKISTVIFRCNRYVCYSSLTPSFVDLVRAKKWTDAAIPYVSRVLLVSPIITHSYSAELAEKVKRGHRENALKHYNNGGTCPIGFVVKDKNYQVDPDTAPFVRYAFEMYDRGSTLQEIVNQLDSEGFRVHKGTSINLNILSRMLRNRKYADDYVYGNFVEKDAIPAIVPGDLFGRVQEKLEKNTKISARYKAPEHYLLTPKLFCGLCGAKLHGESGTSHTKRIHNYYKCSASKKKRTCRKKAVKKDAIERLVIDTTSKSRHL